MKLKDSSYNYGTFIKFMAKGVLVMVIITLLIIGFFKYIY